MKCLKCNKILRKGARFCPACGAKVEKRKSTWFTSILLVGAIIVGVLAIGGTSGILLAKYSGGYRLFDVFSKKNVVKVRNAEEAIFQAKRLGKAYGYENAMSEMTERVTTQVDGDCYYRLQQNYKGIPVYGRTLVLTVDKYGTMQSSVSNVLDVDDGTNITPSITYAQAASTVEEYFRDNFEIVITPGASTMLNSEDTLCIYNMEREALLAYSVSAGMYTVLVDAHNSEIISVGQTLNYVSEKVNDPNGAAELSWKNIDGAYVLGDSKRNIYIYDAGKKTYWDVNSDNINKYAATLVTSGDSAFGNEDDSTDTAMVGVSFLKVLSSIYDFYETELYNEHGCGVIVGIYDDAMGEYNGKNAGGGIQNVEMSLSETPPGYNNGQFNGKIGVMIMGTYYSDKMNSAVDLMGHEYTHMVSDKYIDWCHSSMVDPKTKTLTEYYPENGAVCEGLADIMGELIEYHVSGRTDWINGSRTMYDPALNGYPNNYEAPKKNKNGWILIGSGTDYAHGYSTVLSHAAYLMSQNIPENQLARLWYRAMLMMPSDCNFVECRRTVELAASSMNLSKQQIRCISESFDAVGIIDTETTDIDYKLAPGCALQIMAKDNTPYNNYSVTVTGYSITTSYAKNQPLSVYNCNTYNQTTNVRTEDPFMMPSGAGTYTVTITDNAESALSISFTAFIEPNCPKKELTLYSNFQKPLIVPIRDTPAVGEDIIPGVYVQDGNDYNRLTIHEIRDQQLEFTAFWHRIADISNAKASLSGKIAVFNYSSPQGNWRASGKLRTLSGNKITLEISESTHEYVRVGEYDYTLIGRKFTDAELKEIALSLNVPADLDTLITQGEPTYWEGGGFYRTPIEIYHDGELIAGASVHSLDGTLAGAVLTYEAPVDSSGDNLKMVSTFGFDKAWDIHDRSGAEHFVTTLAFSSDGTFCGAVGWYLSEWYIAFTGTYEVNGDEVVLNYTLDGDKKISSYQVKWKDQMLRQTSEDNIVIVHQSGSEYTFEENPWYTADEFKNQVNTFMRYSE